MPGLQPAQASTCEISVHRHVRKLAQAVLGSLNVLAITACTKPLLADMPSRLAEQRKVAPTEAPGMGY